MRVCKNLVHRGQAAGRSVRAILRLRRTLSCLAVGLAIAVSTIVAADVGTSPAFANSVSPAPPGTSGTSGSVSAGPSVTELCEYNATVPEREDLAGPGTYFIAATATLSCTNGGITDLRFFGCIQHSKVGSGVWGDDKDSCTSADGDLYGGGAFTDDADWNYIHDCVPNPDVKWAYRLHYAETGIFSATGGEFDSGYHDGPVGGPFYC